MQINAYSPSPVVTTPQGAAENSSNPTASQNARTKNRGSSASAIEAPATTTAAPVSTDTVSLRKLSPSDIAALDKQAANDRSNNGSNLVYAEIWKDGMKVGQVFSDGRVTGDGVTIDMGGTSILSAQTRAQQLASQMGGEVRYPGQQDPKAEKMRAQLRAAYGV